MIGSPPGHVMALLNRESRLEFCVKSAGIRIPIKSWKAPGICSRGGFRPQFSPCLNIRIGYTKDEASALMESEE